MKKFTKWNTALVAESVILPTAAIIAVTDPETSVAVAAGVTGLLSFGTVMKSIVINHLATKTKRNEEINEQFVSNLRHELSLARQRAEVDKLALTQELRNVQLIADKATTANHQLKQSLDETVTYNDEQQLQLVEVTQQREKLEQALQLAASQLSQMEDQLVKVTSESIDAITSLSETNEQLKDTVHEIELTCAYCNVKQPLIFNIAAGEFECKNCHNVNAIHTNIFTARTNTLLK